MNRIKEIISKITKQGWIIIGSILVGLIIIAGVIFYVKNPTTWPLSLFTKTQEVEQTEQETIQEVEAEEVALTKEEIIAGQYRNDVASATNYVNNTQEIKIAVVIDENQAIISDDKKSISCGQITFVTYRVVGPAVLTQALRALFNDTVASDFTPGNIIPTYHPELKFEDVQIENGVAKIYLAGTFGGSKDGWCDSSLALAQITETALAFPSVTAVEVYQAGSKIY